MKERLSKADNERIKVLTKDIMNRMKPKSHAEFLALSKMIELNSTYNILLAYSMFHSREIEDAAEGEVPHFSKGFMKEVNGICKKIDELDKPITAAKPTGKGLPSHMKVGTLASKRGGGK
jgi:hypothetical protein